ncbi:hypothetical protein PTTG_28229 [Puccinia triticina 1-1 BBBD Race 1]|uniref:BED-type domain-containing protein n=1 Tax=Puccinia triticina (isolate 1-1 / race 1 (BBBD)) TaxID=630390 RepID=A0A180GDH6_PUCT1|nr:hypothetical protein PTTG_28229 [Puccinia triticina 1-1 BBBD Race 1]
MSSARTRKKRNTQTNHTSTPPSSQLQHDKRPEENTSDKDDPTPNSKQPSLTPASTPLVPLPDEEELKRARKVASNEMSTSYKSYRVPELSNQKDKFGRAMIAYCCKRCNIKINRPMANSSCSNLTKHAAICLRKQQESESNRSLGALGITGTGDINPKEVPQLCAIWCAEAARPFSALVDPSHQALLHPTVCKNLPTRKAVSRDIHKLYSVIQEDYRSTLQAHKGALYLGVDAWQSPNSFDILGVVVYRLAEDNLVFKLVQGLNTFKINKSSRSSTSRFHPS